MSRYKTLQNTPWWSLYTNALLFWCTYRASCTVYYPDQQTHNIYRVSQKECARLRENIPYVKVHRYNPKHLYPKLNGYGDNGQRKCGLLAVPRTVLVKPTRYPYPEHVSPWEWNTVTLRVRYERLVIFTELQKCLLMRAEKCIATGGGHFEQLL